MIPGWNGWIFVLIGYLIGGLSPARLVAALHGQDIRSVGNGNAGASNITMSFGAGYGALVAALDISKGFLAAFLASAACPDPYAMYLAGCAAVLGHVFPIWSLGRKGGKGFAAYIGAFLCWDWRACLALAGIGMVLAFLTDRIVAMTFTYVGGVPAGLALLGHGRIPAALAAMASLLILLRHAENIRLCLEGTEPRVSEALARRRGRPDRD